MRKLHSQKGFTLVELIAAMAAGAILILVMGVLLLGSQNAYRQIYASVNDPIRQDSLMITSAFGTIGRKSNRHHYNVYSVRNDVFSEAIPGVGQSVAAGQAVEFRYWQDSFEEIAQQQGTVDVDDTGTHFTLFYLSGDELHADYGKIVNGVGGVQNGLRRGGDDVETRVLVRDIDVSGGEEIFSHEWIGGAGSGCVNMHMTLKNDEGDTVEIKTATLLRVTWPK